MRPALELPRYPAVLVASLAFWLPSMSMAQEPPGLSSGTGQGTGTGRSAGVQRNPTGSVSGSGPDRMRPGRGFEGEVVPRQIPSGGSIPLGPGVNVRFPDDPGLAPLLGSEDRLGPGGANAAALVSPELIDNVRMITDTYDRSRALQELAREAILSNQLLLAHRTLLQAAQAAVEEQNALRHDQLIIEVITTTGQLTETLIREGRIQLPMPEAREAPAGRPEALPQNLTPRLSIRLARLEWQRARVLARAVINPTYRSEYLARVAEGLGRDSSRIMLEYIRRNDLDNAPQAEKLTETEIKEVETAADGFLVEAQQVCQEIERPIWKNTALERTAINAGESQQYPRAFSIARSIQNAEARSQALILVAESQCRHRPGEATATYAEVAEAVARVDQDGLRGVLTGYLVDSLISTGRFEDARACLVFYPTASEKFVAMGAIAESEGRRGSAERARQWIASEAPPSYRPVLYRRVNSGVLAKIGNSRQSLFSGRDAQPPTPTPTPPPQ